METRVAVSAAREAAECFLDRLPSDLDVSCYMAHGDFTRWNVLRAADGSARIMDWELYGLKPRWFDVLHYLVSHDLLVKQIPPERVFTRLRQVASEYPSLAADWLQQVGLYFCYQSLYYTTVFERQADLHVQAIWQLTAWAEILSLLSAEFGES